ncbi:LD-carboxypeptidase [Colletotrichum graminicola]|uniref:LD-carboxypeptidase n=1 Tax=Colletotrichum graminicola (strain M1.001 / M2 / FGSC 10212) TaxID=645133 RepID=E3QCZ4_COLGM|nr:LD-carboxypeptidase [Colletotrichum graminicola M1.001]EFQ28766.1 LD-carboxypeptidase [Colletotrichum graminicola M1.001]WDK18895.1 LD-carboxypeptidase [Colletotrichum graminicola]
MSSFPPPIIPKALRPGAKIAFLSPSGRIDPKVIAPLARAETLLRSLGYVVTNIYSEVGERTPSGGGGGGGAVDPVDASIRNRLAELRTAFADPTVDMIFCTVGGSTMTQLIPYLVEDVALHALVRANPKIVVGYSDITVLHWCLRALTGLRTFYGPCAALELGGEVDAAAFTPASVSSFSPSASVPEDPAEGDAYVHEFHLATLLQAISHPGRPLGPVPRSRFYAPLIPSYFFPPPSPPPTNTRALLPSPGRAEGRLFGGCLTVVSRIQGIPRITPDWRGRILFLESATGEGDQTKGNPLGRVQQAVADLAARGVFDELAGLVIGRPYGYNTGKERARYAAAFRGLLCHGRLADRKFPILMNVDVSHTSPKVTLPMDALAVLDSDKNELAITEAAVL